MDGVSEIIHYDGKKSGPTLKNLKFFDDKGLRKLGLTVSSAVLADTENVQLAIIFRPDELRSELSATTMEQKKLQFLLSSTNIL